MSKWMADNRKNRQINKNPDFFYTQINSKTMKTMSFWFRYFNSQVALFVSIFCVKMMQKKHPEKQEVWRPLNKLDSNYQDFTDKRCLSVQFLYFKVVFEPAISPAYVCLCEHCVLLLLQFSHMMERIQIQIKSTLSFHFIPTGGFQCSYYNLSFGKNQSAAIFAKC